MSEPSVSRYALETHCWPARPPPRSLSMDGSATLTTVASSPATNDPRIAARSARRLRRSDTRPCYGGGDLRLRRQWRVGPCLAADSKRRGPEPPGVLSAASAPEGAGHGFRAAGLTTPGPRSLRFGSASGRHLWSAPTAVKTPLGAIPQTPAISVRPLRDLVHWVEQSTGATAVSALAID